MDWTRRGFAKFISSAVAGFRLGGERKEIAVKAVEIEKVVYEATNANLGITNEAAVTIFDALNKNVYKDEEDILIAAEKYLPGLKVDTRMCAKLTFCSALCR